MGLWVMTMKQSTTIHCDTSWDVFAAHVSMDAAQHLSRITGSQCIPVGKNL
jgi:hypothetical protein